MEQMAKYTEKFEHPFLEQLYLMTLQFSFKYKFSVIHKIGYLLMVLRLSGNSHAVINNWRKFDKNWTNYSLKKA
jgi:hypothetical protein